MHIDRRLLQLRGDPAPQQQAQIAVERARDEWKRREDVARMFVELEAFGRGMSLSNCPTLDTMVHEPPYARILVDALIDEMSAALELHPLGQVPFRHQYSGGIGVLQLAEAGRASLSLVTYERLPDDRQAVAETVCFAGGERYECYLAGSAQADIFEIIEDHGDRVILDRRRRGLCGGDTLILTDDRMTKLVHTINGRLVMLRLCRSATHPDPAREFHISDGRLVHRASGRREESRKEMAMALLGRMGRSDASDVLAEIAFEGSEHLRWQAVRECLALDTAVGFRTLCRIAADPGDTLSDMAGTLRARLIETHPQLAAI